jgi:hypothetical protein
MDLAAGQFALEHGVPVVASWDAERGVVTYQPNGQWPEIHRPAEGNRESSTMINSAGRPTSERILKMRKQGHKVARIAAELGISLKEVLTVCQQSRPDAKHVPPTPEEIAERGAAIRRAQGHPSPGEDEA